MMMSISPIQDFAGTAAESLDPLTSVGAAHDLRACFVGDTRRRRRPCA